MGSAMTDLPPGFVLDHQPSPTTGGDLPAGFVLDQQQAPSVAGDIANAAGSRLVQGGLGLAGFFGDLDSLANQGVNFVNRQIGLPERQRLGKGVVPTTEDIQDFTGLHGYQPKTEWGKTFDRYAGPVLEFVPGAVALGPGGVVKNIATKGFAGGAKAIAGNAVKYGVVPGVASEGAGEAAGAVDPSFEGAGRLAGAILGGGVAAARDIPRPTAPSVEEIKAASGQLYKQTEDAGVVLAQPSFNGLVKNIRKAVDDSAIDKTLHPGATRAMARLEQAAGSSPDLKKLDQLRQIARDAADGGSPGDARVANVIIDKIDNYVDFLGAKDVVGGDPKNVGAALKQARSLWRQQIKGQIIEDAMTRANLSDAASKGNIDSAMRTAFRSIAYSKNKFKKFSPEEQKAIEEVVTAGKGERLLKFLGKFDLESSPRTALLAAFLGNRLGELVGFPGLGTAVGPLVGMAGQAAAGARTVRQAQRASALVRGGSQERWIAGRRAPLLNVYYNSAIQRDEKAKKIPQGY